MLLGLSALFSDEEHDLNDDVDIAPMESDRELLEAEKLDDGPLESQPFPFLMKS